MGKSLERLKELTEELVDPLTAVVSLSKELQNARKEIEKLQSAKDEVKKLQSRL